MSDERGLDRRGFLQCMAWTGTGLVWSVVGGVPGSRALGPGSARAQGAGEGWSFVQISDTHIGFKGAANPDAMGTFEVALARIKALDPKPAFVIHTGDITHAQKAGAFDTVSEALKGVGAERTFYVPGENDVFADGGTEYLGRFAAGGSGRGWQSFDYRGVHFVGLVDCSTSRRASSGAWAASSSSGPSATWRRSPPARRSWSSPTCRSGRCTRSGAGSPRTGRRPSAT